MPDSALLLDRSTFSVADPALLFNSSFPLDRSGLQVEGIYRVQTGVSLCETFEGSLR
jgi:hypothetical protein